MATTLPSGGTISTDTEIIFQDYPTYTYRIDHITNQIRGFTDELDAMRQAVEIILNVERYEFQIYSANAGVSFKDLIGEEYGFVTSELERRINDAFVPDTRITGTSNWEFVNNYETSSLYVSFYVHTVFGNLPVGTEIAYA